MTKDEAKGLIGRRIRNVWNSRQCLRRSEVTVRRIDDGGCIYMETETGKVITYFARSIKSWEECE